MSPTPSAPGPPPGPRRPPASPPGHDRGVSPIVAVILIIAIIIVLVGVIGSSFLDFGGELSSTAPQAQLEVSVDASTDTVTIEHKGGDSLSTERTRVVITIGASDSEWSATGSGDLLTAGESATFDFSGSDEGPSSGPWSSYGAEDGGSNDQIDPGDDVEVRIVDTETGNVIFRWSGQA